MTTKSIDNKRVRLKLPFGSQTRISKRYLEKTGKTISPQYIPQAIDKGNQEIIAIAIEVVKEMKSEQKEKMKSKRKLERALK